MENEFDMSRTSEPRAPNKKALRYLSCEGESKPELLSELAPIKKTLPVLKRERPQKDYKLVDDVPTHVGWLEMYTIQSDWLDEQGRNRKGSTFGVLGLAELGIDPAQCEVLS